MRRGLRSQRGGCQGPQTALNQEVYAGAWGKSLEASKRGWGGKASLARWDLPVCKTTARSKTAPGEQLGGGADVALLHLPPKGQTLCQGPPYRDPGAVGAGRAEPGCAPAPHACPGFSPAPPYPVLTYPGPGGPQQADPTGRFRASRFLVQHSGDVPVIKWPVPAAQGSVRSTTHGASPGPWMSLHPYARPRGGCHLQ